MPPPSSHAVSLKLLPISWALGLSPTVSPSEMFPVVKLQRERKQKAKQKGRGGERELSRRVSPQVNLVNQRQPSLLSWQENILTTSKHLVVQSVIKNGGLSI